MRKCPQCGTIIKRGEIEGALVYGYATVDFSLDGDVEIVGPIISRVVVKNIKAARRIFMECDCGYVGDLTTYSTVRICPVTGREAQFEVEFDRGIKMWFADSEAVEVFRPYLVTGSVALTDYAPQIAAMRQVSARPRESNTERLPRGQQSATSSPLSGRTDRRPRSGTSANAGFVNSVDMVTQASAASAALQTQDSDFVLTPEARTILERFVENYDQVTSGVPNEQSSG